MCSNLDHNLINHRPQHHFSVMVSYLLPNLLYNSKHLCAKNHNQGWITTSNQLYAQTLRKTQEPIKLKGLLRFI